MFDDALGYLTKLERGMGAKGERRVAKNLAIAQRFIHFQTFIN
jgi:hypothetical protein